MTYLYSTSHPYRLLSAFNTRFCFYGKFGVERHHTTEASTMTLDRASEYRCNEEWLKNARTAESTSYIIFSGKRASPFVESVDSKPSNRLLRFRHTDIDFNTCLSVFLGLEGDRSEKRPLFAVDIVKESKEAFESRHRNGFFLPAFPGIFHMSDYESLLCSHACSLFTWHRWNTFCAACGSPTQVIQAGYKRRCLNESCTTHKVVVNISYPRLDPSALVLVTSPDGQSCLLGRKESFPAKLYSCLAGFVDIGESLEEACVREIKEESGIIVSELKYHSSQSWPFPSCLLLGFTGRAVNDTITIDYEEQEDIRWFHWKDVRDMLEFKHKDGYWVPPRKALAHRLLKQWTRSLSKL